MRQLEKREERQGLLNGLWSLLRTGFPLLAIYNMTGPTDQLVAEKPSTNDSKTNDQAARSAIFQFINGCVDELGIEKGKMFIVSELMSNDVLKFSKVRPIFPTQLNHKQLDTRAELATGSRYYQHSTRHC
jgi:cell division control protein 24